MPRLHLNIVTGRMSLKSSSAGVERQVLNRERSRNRRAIDKARALAAEHSISIDDDDQGGWWVTCNAKFTEENDPLQGGNFCSSGREVLEAVEAYVSALVDRDSAG